MTACKKLFVLGSTGSIGTQTLDIARQNPDRIQIVGLSANSNWRLLADQVNEFQPEYAIIHKADALSDLKEAVSHSKTRFLVEETDMLDLVADAAYDILVNALVGFAGFHPTVRALQSDKTVALANKESLVVGGALLKSYCGEENRKLIPVDSEHSAILQCLTGEHISAVEKLIITASGGPFREMEPSEMKKIRVEDALNHPNWDMGAKITIDSATMMNKGLEVIEARWLFDLPAEKIEAVIHPQSIIHSMVTFSDGSTKAQLGLPDMKVPIQYAISYPERWNLSTPRMDWSLQQQLTFQPVDHKRFPCFKLALDALTTGGHAPAVLNASNEVAVARFLNREIRYDQIAEIVEHSLEKLSHNQSISVGSLQDIDSQTRYFAQQVGF